MPKGVTKKPDYKKPGEVSKPEEQDTPSPVDLGKDFVKPGERSN